MDGRDRHSAAKRDREMETDKIDGESETGEESGEWEDKGGQAAGGGGGGGREGSKNR